MLEGNWLFQMVLVIKVKYKGVGLVYGLDLIAETTAPATQTCIRRQNCKLSPVLWKSINLASISQWGLIPPPQVKLQITVIQKSSF